LWGEPRIVLVPTPRALGLEVLAPREIAAAAGPSAPARARAIATERGLRRCRVETQAPGATCLFFRRPEPAALPLDLRAAPFTWTPAVDGLPLPLDDRPAYLGAGAAEGISAGVTMPALAAHPPIGGSTAVDYLLTLPKSPPAELSFSAGIQDGAKGTNGVAFVVEVNGQEAGRQEVAGPDGWHPVRVDLGAYAGRTILLSLVVDALGDATCDWARWGAPRLQPRDG
jgi:hypothetical protein